MNIGQVSWTILICLGISVAVNLTITRIRLYYAERLWLKGIAQVVGERVGRLETNEHIRRRLMAISLMPVSMGQVMGRADLPGTGRTVSKDDTRLN
jgi:hypothetical protein